MKYIGSRIKNPSTAAIRKARLANVISEALVNRSCAITLLALLAGASLSADNWPTWRGVSTGGVSPETNLPIRWSDTENIAWQTPLMGLGVSSPIAWGDRIIVTSQQGAGMRRSGSHPSLAQGPEAATSGETGLGGRAFGEAYHDRNVTFVVTALDRLTGRKVWEHAFKAEGTLPELHDKHNLASPSPATDGERIYAWFGSGQIVATDMNGNVVWQRHLGRDYGNIDITWGPGSSPTVHNGTVYLLNYHGAVSYLLAVDARTGATRWKVDAPKGTTSYSTPVVAQGPRGPEIVINSSMGVAGHDVTTGERLWFFTEDNRFPIPAAVGHEGTVYLNRGFRSSPYMAIRLGGRGDIAKSHVAWRVPTSGPYVPSLVFYQGLLYMANDLGIVSAVDAATGERVWQERLAGVYSASPVAGDGKIYFVSETGETLVLQAGRALNVLARNDLNARFVASPAIAGGRVFLRADDRVIAVGK